MPIAGLRRVFWGKIDGEQPLNWHMANIRHHCFLGLDGGRSLNWLAGVGMAEIRQIYTGWRGVWADKRRGFVTIVLGLNGGGTPDYQYSHWEVCVRL